MSKDPPRSPEIKFSISLMSAAGLLGLNLVLIAMISFDIWCPYSPSWIFLWTAIILFGKIWCCPRRTNGRVDVVRKEPLLLYFIKSNLSEKINSWQLKSVCTLRINPFFLLKGAPSLIEDVPVRTFCRAISHLPYCHCFSISESD